MNFKIPLNIFCNHIMCFLDIKEGFFNTPIRQMIHYCMRIHFNDSFVFHKWINENIQHLNQLETTNYERRFKIKYLSLRTLNLQCECEFEQCMIHLTHLSCMSIHKFNSSLLPNLQKLEINNLNCNIKKLNFEFCTQLVYMDIHQFDQNLILLNLPTKTLRHLNLISCHIIQNLNDFHLDSLKLKCISQSIANSICDTLSHLTIVDNEESVLCLEHLTNLKTFVCENHTRTKIVLPHSITYINCCDFNWGDSVQFNWPLPNLTKLVFLHTCQYTIDTMNENIQEIDCINYDIQMSDCLDFSKLKIKNLKVVDIIGYFKTLPQTLTKLDIWCRSIAIANDVNFSYIQPRVIHIKNNRFHTIFCHQNTKIVLEQ